MTREQSWVLFLLTTLSRNHTSKVANGWRGEQTYERASLLHNRVTIHSLSGKSFTPTYTDRKRKGTLIPKIVKGIHSNIRQGIHEAAKHNLPNFITCDPLVAIPTRDSN